MRRNKLKLKPLELGGKLYNDWKNQLVFTERYILKELGFSLYSTMDHPHKYILYFVKLLSGSNKLSQTAWNYLNDSSRLDLGLRYPARDLACASIYMAARLIEFPLPHNPPWWSVMADDIDRIYEVCEEILSVYNVPEV
jgi:transcription initiation factor TFIIIB Brf1 subunit/transcription initiation factor TFIIB